MTRCLLIATIFVFILFFFFFFNDTATTEIYTLSLHDALPISLRKIPGAPPISGYTKSESQKWESANFPSGSPRDRKSTRLNSSHLGISYAVFCLRSEEHTSELQSLRHLVCRLLLEKTTTQYCD